MPMIDFPRTHVRLGRFLHVVHGRRPVPAAQGTGHPRTFLAALSLLLLGASSPNSQSSFPVRLESGGAWPGHALGGPVEVQGSKPVVVLSGVVSKARIGPVHIIGAYRAIETAKTATVIDLVVDGLRGEVLRECFRVRGSKIVIRNTICTQFGGARTKLGDLPEGLHIESGSEILVEDSRFDGFQYIKEPTKYWNGDGIAAERGVTGLVIRNVVANDSTDAGFDIKPPVRMDGVSAEGNCRNYRFWADADVGAMSVGRTVHRGGTSPCAGIWIKGDDANPARVTIDRLHVTSFGESPFLVVEHGRAAVQISTCDIRTKARLVAYVQERQDLRLGRGCRAIQVETGPPPAKRQSS